MSGHSGAEKCGAPLVGSSTWAAALALLSRFWRNAHSNFLVKRASIFSSRSRLHVRCSSPGCATAVLLCLCGGRPDLPLPAAMRRPLRRGVGSRGSGHPTPAGAELASSGRRWHNRPAARHSLGSERLVDRRCAFAPAPETARRGLTTRAGPLSFLAGSRDG